MIRVNVRHGRYFRPHALVSVSEGGVLVRDLHNGRLAQYPMNRLKRKDALLCFAILGGFDVEIVIERTGYVQRANQRKGEKEGKAWEINEAELVSQDSGFMEIFPFESFKSLLEYNNKQVKCKLRAVAKRTAKDAELVLKVVEISVISSASAPKAAS